MPEISYGDNQYLYRCQMIFQTEYALMCNSDCLPVEAFGQSRLIWSNLHKNSLSLSLSLPPSILMAILQVNLG